MHPHLALRQRISRFSLPSIVSLAVIWSLAAPRAAAQVITWNNPAGGNWNTAANWNPPIVPNGAGESALIPANQGTYTVTLNTSPTLDRLTIDNTAATFSWPYQILTLLLPAGLVNAGIIQISGSAHYFGNFTNRLNASLRVLPACTLNLHTLALTDSGAIIVHSAAGASNSYQRIYEDMLLEGPGTLILQTSGTPDDAQILTEAGITLTQAAGHTICGTGTISALLVNDGVVRGDVNGQSMLLNGYPKTNNATMKATNGGILELACSVNQGSGGLMLADSGTVSFGAAASVENAGTLRASRNGLVSIAQGTMFNSGLVEAGDSGTVLITDGSFTNSGTACAAGNGLFRAASLPANYAGNTLIGGTWRVSDHGIMRLIGADIREVAGFIVLDGSDSHIYRDEGTTDALANLDAVTNQGGFELRGGRNFTTAGSLSNGGVVRIGPTDDLVVNGRYTQTGGRTMVDGTLDTAEGTLVQSGWLEGLGVVQGTVVNPAGLIHPGSGVLGTLTIAGDYDQSAAGAAYIEIGGRDAGEYDRLVVSGQARLSGRLWIVPVGGFEGAIGDTFQVMTFGSRQGEFTEAFLNGWTGRRLQLVHRAHAVTVVVYGDAADVGEDPVDSGDNGNGGGEADGKDPHAGHSSLPAVPRLTAALAAGGTALLTLDLPRPGRCLLSLFDIGGGHVIDLRDEILAAGRHLIPVDGASNAGSRLRSGIYFARLVVRSDGKTEEHLVRILILR